MTRATASTVDLCSEDIGVATHPRVAVGTPRPYAHGDARRLARSATDEFYTTRVVFDIEGNQREVFDAHDRVVVRYQYDMLGARLHR